MSIPALVAVMTDDAGTAASRQVVAMVMDVSNLEAVNVTDTTASIQTVLYFDDKKDVHSMLRFFMKKVGDAWLIVGRILGFAWADPAVPLLAVGLVVSVWVYQLIHESRARWVLGLAPVRVGLVVAMALYVALVARSPGAPFIYFQF